MENTVATLDLNALDLNTIPAVAEPAEPVRRGRGRPKGSKNKPKPRPPGRPKGSRNKEGYTRGPSKTPSKGFLQKLVASQAEQIDRLQNENQKLLAQIAKEQWLQGPIFKEILDAEVLDVKTVVSPFTLDQDGPDYENDSPK